MQYCEPRNIRCAYVQWTGADSLEDVESFLGASRTITDENISDGNIELYYRTGARTNVHIPQGYYIVDYGRGNGGKEVVHPDMFHKKFKEKPHD